MKVKTITLFTVAALLGSNACTKKTFEALKVPTTMIKIKSDEKIDLLQEPLKDGVVAWTDSVENIEVEGLLRVVSRSKSYFYWQMKCPPALTCNGEKLYLPVISAVTSEPGTVPFANELPPVQKIQAIVVKLDDVYVALQTTKFIASLKGPLPDKILEPVFNAYLDKLGRRSPEGIETLLKLYLYSVLGTSAYESDELPRGLRQVPEGTLKAIRSVLPPKAGEKPKTSLVYLKNYAAGAYSAYLEDAVKDFPLQAKTYKALAQNYKTLARFPGLREKILMRIYEEKTMDFENGDSKAPNQSAPDLNEVLQAYLARPKITLDSAADGLLIQAKEGKDEYFAEIRLGEADKKGLRFLLSIEPKNESARLALAKVGSAQTPHTSPTTSEQAATNMQTSSDVKAAETALATENYIWLVPRETSVYIEGVKKFEKDALAMKKEITDANFDSEINHRSLLEFAIKYGEGGYNSQTGQYDYKVTLKPGKVYNNFLKMAKNTIGASPSEYSGELPPSFAEAPQMAGQSSYNLRWFQLAKDGYYQFGITGSLDTTYRSNNFSENVSETCFAGNSDIHIWFNTNNLSTQLPEKVSVNYGNSGNLCDKILIPQD